MHRFSTLKVGVRPKVLNYFVYIIPKEIGLALLRRVDINALQW